MRSALGSLRQSPRTAIVVTGTLAIAIALVTTVFSALNAYSWRALPYEEADRLVALGVAEPGPPGPLGLLDTDDILRIRAMEDAFDDVAPYSVSDRAVRVRGAAVRATTVTTDGALLRVLRVRPALGRTLSESDEAAAVLSFAGWRRHFGEDAGAVGRTLYVAGVPHTIVGVLPEAFTFEKAELFIPVDAATREFQAIARLSAGVTAGGVDARLRTMRPSGPDTDGAARLALSPDMVQRASILRAGVLPWLFLGSTLLVLLAACANVVTMLMARAVARGPQYAVRAALGASRWRLALDSFMESLLLATMAAALGLLLSTWILDALLAALPTLPSWMRFTPDYRVFAFAAGAGLLASFAVGIMPARYAAAPDLQLLMKGGSGNGRTVSQTRLTRGLVSFEIAVSVGLFIVTMLLVRSYDNALQIDPGYAASEVLAFDVDMDAHRQVSMIQVDAHREQALQQLSSHQLVQAGSWSAEFDGYRSAVNDTAAAERRPQRYFVQLADGQRTPRRTALRVAGPDYFETIGLPLLEGRSFGAADTEDGPGVAVVTQEFARRAWSDQSALGRVVRIDTAGGRATALVVGIVSNPVVLRSDRSGMWASPESVVYVPGAQAIARRFTLLARTTRPDVVAPAAASALRALDPDLPVEDVATLAARDNVGIEPRMFGMLFGVIGTSALVLALIGMYGIVSYATQQRTREIGLRVALGATPRRIATDVLRSGMRVTVTGVVLGSMLALALSSLVRRLLLDVHPIDVPVYVGVALLFALVAVVAAYLPGRRAMRVDPMVALRSE